MTCEGCATAVTKNLSMVNGVQQVKVDLKEESATITMTEHVGMSDLQAALPDKYIITDPTNDTPKESADPIGKVSKVAQLKPLFLIFLYLFMASFLMHFKNWDTNAAMLDFMGLFYVVFSFFKLLDLKGFPESFAMYDPLAKAVPVYGRIYPFLEVLLGLLFLFRIQITLALVATILILGITTFGVIRTLIDKKRIRCACLGTALNLPMTEATFIENAIMLLMAIVMLYQSIFLG